MNETRYYFELTDEEIAALPDNELSDAYRQSQEQLAHWRTFKPLTMHPNKKAEVIASIEADRARFWLEIEQRIA
jgi:hypothetical protein